MGVFLVCVRGEAAAATRDNTIVKDACRRQRRLREELWIIMYEDDNYNRSKPCDAWWLVK